MGLHVPVTFYGPEVNVANRHMVVLNKHRVLEEAHQSFRWKHAIEILERNRASQSGGVVRQKRSVDIGFTSFQAMSRLHSNMCVRDHVKICLTDPTTLCSTNPNYHCMMMDEDGL